MIEQVGCIVEGHGEIEAVPILVRRIGHALTPPAFVNVPKPVRVPRSKLVRPEEIERAVELTARRIGPDGAILIVVDSDEDCPAQLGPTLLRRAVAVRGDMPMAVVLAKKEFEAWFIASAESLAAQGRLAAGTVAPVDPEAIRDAKGWLSERMSSVRRYGETLDQPGFSALFDVAVARRAPSFDKLVRDVTRLLTSAPRSGTPALPPAG